MQLARKIVLTMLASCVILAASAAAAGATNLYVATSGSDTNACTNPAKPCLTIPRAIEVAREDHGKATIYVAAGTYTGEVDLESALDNGDVVVGAGHGETTLENAGAEPTVGVAAGIAVRLEDLLIRHGTADSAPAVSANGAKLTMKAIEVDAKGSTGEAAVSDAASPSSGALALIGCDVRQSGENGVAVAAPGSIIDVTSSTLEAAGEGGSALEGTGATMAVEKSTLVIRGGASRALKASLAAVALSGSTVEALGPDDVGLLVNRGSLVAQNSRLVVAEADSVGIESEGARVTAEGDTIEADEAGDVGLLAGGGNDTLVSDIVVVNAPADAQPAILHEGAGETTLRRVRVGGTWNGPALAVHTAGHLSIVESKLIATNGTSAAPAVVADSARPGGLAVQVQRSRIAAAPDASSALIDEAPGSFAMDSSIVQGGLDGLTVAARGAGAERAVVAASTVDAGTRGASNEAGVTSIASELAQAGATLSVDVEGSILFEPTAATLGPGASSLTVSCHNSDVPSEVQPESAGVGAINCRAGAHGNENLPGLGSIFASPITNYLPRKRSRIVNTVPANTISLGFGLKPATYDLDGRKRDLYGRIGRRCELAQDRGALQAPGQRADCKPKRRR